MTRPRLPHLSRPLLLTSLILLGLALCLIWQVLHGGSTPRLVSPLPLYAPGFTLKTADGMPVRLIPLAGSQLRSRTTSQAAD